jgi:hypothetical protein
MIHATSRGQVAYSLPYMRDYLRDHDATEAHHQISGPDTEPGALPPGD